MAATEEIDHSIGDEVSDYHVAVADDPTSTGSSSTQAQCDSGHERLIQKKTVSNGLQHSRPSNPPNYLWLAVLVSFCNCPFGIIGVVFALLSRSSQKKHQYKDAKTWGNIAKWLSIVGIAVSFVAIMILLVYFLCVDARIVDTIGELRKELPNVL